MKKITLNLGDYGQYFKPIKPVKRSYKKSAKGASIKAPKVSSKKTSTKKAPRTKASTAKGVSVKKTQKKNKTTKAPTNAQRRNKKQGPTLAELELREALRESGAADRSKAHDWDRALTEELKVAEKDYRRAVREYNEAQRKERAAEREAKRTARQNKAVYITKNKLEAEYGKIKSAPEYIDRGIASIADKINEYYNTSPERREKLSAITGLNMDDFDMGNPSKRKQALVNALYKSVADENGNIEVQPAAYKVTDIYRGLESFNRKERLHAKGIEMDMDEDTAKDIMLDILNSNSVSAETKEVLRILGPQGALLYVNYRQIQKLKYGDLYREQLYAPAAEVFWDKSEADKVILKKFGYRFSNKTAKYIDDSGVGTAGHIDATQFAKFAMTKMKSQEEAEEFLKKLYAATI